MSFPRIHSFDSSRTPQRDARVAAPRTLAAVDLSAITTAMAEMDAFTANGGADSAPNGRGHVLDLERRLRQQDRELAAARARVAEMEAEAGAMQARLEQAEKREARAAPG